MIDEIHTKVLLKEVTDRYKIHRTLEIMDFLEKQGFGRQARMIKREFMFQRQS